MNQRMMRVVAYLIAAGIGAALALILVISLTLILTD